MSNEIFIARKIDELPRMEKQGHYIFIRKDGTSVTRSIWDPKELVVSEVAKWYKSWLEKVTIEQLIAEHPEVVEKIFEAGRATLDDGWGYAHKTFIDYINSLKQ